VIEEPGKKKALIVAIVLWLITAVLSVVCLLTVRTLVLSTLARFGLSDAVPVANWLIVVLMVVFCIGVVIGGFELHFRHPGEPRSWQMFSWTIGIEAAILLLAVFI
jgi:hypothetical protein